MTSLFGDNQADITEAFNSTSRYLDNLLNIDNPYSKGMVNQIYPPELQLNKAYASDSEDPFLDLHLSILMVLFPPKFVIYVMTLILILKIFLFWMAIIQVIPLLLWNVYFSTYKIC